MSSAVPSLPSAPADDTVISSSEQLKMKACPTDQQRVHEDPNVVLELDR